MDKVIENILISRATNQEKYAQIEKLEKDIEMARKILSGECKYCKECHDYYLSKSFFTETKVKNEKICTYNDPINSSGNEYKDGQVRYTYLICPKGHRDLQDRQEI